MPRKRKFVVQQIDVRSRREVIVDAFVFRFAAKLYHDWGLTPSSNSFSTAPVVICVTEMKDAIRVTVASSHLPEGIKVVYEGPYTKKTRNNTVFTIELEKGWQCKLHC